MVSDTRSTLRGRNGVADEKNLKKKIAVPAQPTPPQGIRKSKRLENEAAPPTSSPMRKSERLEKHKTPSPSPSSKSDRGRGGLAPGSSGQKPPAKELSFSEEKMSKEQKRKNLMEVSMASEKAEFQQEEVVKKRKKMTGASYKAIYNSKAPQRIRLPDGEVYLLNVHLGPPPQAPDEKFMAAVVTDMVVNAAPGRDGLPNTQTAPCSRETLSDKIRPAASSSPVTKADSLDSASSISLPRPQDGSAHSESGKKCADSKDCNGVMERLQDTTESGEKQMHAEDPEITPGPESEDVNLSGNCLLCSKRKRISACSTENDLCSCGGIAREGLGQYSSCKEGDDEPVAVLGSAGNCNSVDRLKASPENSSGEILKKNPHSIADGGTSKFLEYWLPVQISFYQLEQYCEALLSNSIHLCSCDKKDTNGALRETLLRVRKCCEHPYLLDLSFQNRLIKEEKRQAPEVLDVAIKVCGKLEVLDMMLAEIKSRGSQALILLQLIPASGKDMLSNIDLLDEFLNKRFGKDSYERIEALTSKKQTAVDRFNKKENGVFVLLLEKAACSSAIKLLSLDNIIIYGSENPSNDLKTLQKLSFDSKISQVKVFRLYSSCTFEERALILTKKHPDFASSMQTISRTSRSMVDNLLMWGASHLFSKLNLNDCHIKNSSSLNVSSQHLFLGEVMEEFRSILGGSYGNDDGTSIISRANKLDDGGYKTSIPLLGETQITMKDGEEPHLFWKNVLELRSPPCWKFLVEPSPRNRKRVQFSNTSPSEADADNGNVGNKRKKVGTGNGDAAAVCVELNSRQATQVADAERANNSMNDRTFSVSEGKDLESADKTALAVDHNNFHNSLLAELKKLCNVLEYSENVTGMAIKLLEYYTKNHRLGSDSPATIVQAFQISLCWKAASDSKIRVDKEGSLLMAKHHLNYQCSEEEAYNVYQKIKSLKNTDLAEQGVNRESSSGDEGAVQPIEVGEKSDEEQFEIIGGGSEVDEEIVKLQEKCLKRLKRLKRKQRRAMLDFYQSWDKKKHVMENDHQLQLAFTRKLYGESPIIRKEKLQNLEDVFAKKVEEHNLLRDVALKELEAEQLADINAEKQKADLWLQEAKACSSEPIIGGGPPTQTEILVTSDSKNKIGVTEVNSLLMDMVEQPTQPNYICNNGELESMEPPASDNHPADVTKESPVELAEASTAKTDPKENNKMEALASENLASELHNQEEMVGQNQPSLHLEVAGLGPTNTVQANSGLQEDEREEAEPEGIEILEKESQTMTNHEDKTEEVKIHEGGPEEGEILEKESPAMDNHSTVLVTKSVSVALVAPVAEPEGNVGVLEKLDTSKTPVETLEFVDSPTNALTSKPLDSPTNAQSNVELQEQVPPLAESESIVGVANSDIDDTMEPVQPITEQAPTNVPTVQTQSTYPPGGPLSKTAGTAVPLQLSIEIPVINSEEMDRASPRCNQLEADHLRSVQRINCSQTAQVAETNILSHESVSQTREILDMSTRVHGQSIELPTSERNAAIPPAVIDSAECLSDAVLQSGINGSHYTGTGYAVHPSTPQVHVSTNPIGIEVERLCREIFNLDKTQLDMAARLKSDCEREVEEITKQIKEKYDLKLQVSEAEYRQKKTGVEKNLTKLKMNLKLANAFSEKCLDRPPANSGYQQGTSLGVHMQQMQRPLMQPRFPASASSFPLSSSHPVANPSPSHLNANPLQPFPSHLNTNHVEQRPMPRVPLSHPMRPSPATSRLAMAPPFHASQATSHSVMVPPVQAGQRTPAPSRPLVINSITPRNHRGSVEMRCQAPHLQSFRGAHGPPTAPSTNSPSISQYQPILPLSQQSAVQLSQNGPGHQPQGAPHFSPSASASALMHHHRLRPASLPERSPSPSFSPANQSPLGALGNVQGNHASPNVAEDLVCLSDDD